MSIGGNGCCSGSSCRSGTCQRNNNHQVCQWNGKHVGNGNAHKCCSRYTWNGVCQNAPAPSNVCLSDDGIGCVVGRPAFNGNGCTCCNGLVVSGSKCVSPSSPEPIIVVDTCLSAGVNCTAEEASYDASIPGCPCCPGLKVREGFPQCKDDDRRRLRMLEAEKVAVVVLSA